jgi:hypothetical protein
MRIVVAFGAGFGRVRALFWTSLERSPYTGRTPHW